MFMWKPAIIAIIIIFFTVWVPNEINVIYCIRYGGQQNSTPLQKVKQSLRMEIIWIHSLGSSE